MTEKKEVEKKEAAGYEPDEQHKAWLWAGGKIGRAIDILVLQASNALTAVGKHRELEASSRTEKEQKAYSRGVIKGHEFAANHLATTAELLKKLVGMK